MPVAELLARITSGELTEWMAYERVTGTLGPERNDFLHAITATTVANANRGKGKAPVKVSAFMPKWDRGRQSWEEQLAIVRQLNAAMGGADHTRG